MAIYIVSLRNYPDTSSSRTAIPARPATLDGTCHHGTEYCNMMSWREIGVMAQNR